MPPRPSVYRSFVTCSDPEGIVDCGTVRKSRFTKMESSIERQKMPKSLNMSCASGEEVSLKGGVGNTRNSASQLEEIEKGAQKLNQMIESWASGMNIDGQSKDIAQDLLRGALDLQDSLNMLSKLQEASLYMAKLKRLERHMGERGVQNSRVSVDGSSRNNRMEELKKAIQDSYARQNLLPVTCVDSQCDKRGISWATEIQSTSSSQSSVYFSKKACSTDNSSVSSDISDKNQKRPNLIAKLMGLDDRKLVQAITSTSNELQKEKDVPARPAFDIDVPKARKPQLETLKTYQEKRTLRDLLEATQTKAHLRSKFVERLIPVFDLRPRNPQTNQSRVEADKFPPIVIIKPMHAPHEDMEKTHDLQFKSNKRGLDASEIVKELKAKNHFSRVQDQVTGRGTVIQNEKSSTAQVLTQEKSKLPKVVVPKLQSTKTKIKEKAVVSMEQTRANKILKTEKSADVSKITKKSSKEKNGSGMKLLVPKEALDSPVKVRNPDKNLSIMKTQTSSRQKFSQHTVSKFTKESARHYSIGVKKTQKKMEKPITQPHKTDTLRHEDDGAAAELSSQVSVEKHAVPLPVKTKINTEAEIEDNWKDVEVLHHTSHKERSYEYSNAVNRETVTSNTSSLKSRSFKENLLLSSPSFAALVEVHFNLDVTGSEVVEVKPSIHIQADTTLFISYAKEVIERQSQLLPYGITSARIPISLHQLVGEVCDACEAIDSYKDGTPTVDIFDMLNRDMKCKEVVSSVWDLGWKKVYSARETEQIVADIERLILVDFIDEIFVH